MLRLAALSILLLAAAPRASGLGDLGLSLKAGEGAGGFGAQAAYNFDPHWQAALGVGGAGIPYLINYGKIRTDSYYLLGKYYFQHLYVASGYSLKRTRVVVAADDDIHRGTASAHGIPLHLGYEFGNRLGFYFAASAGVFYVFKDGGQRVMGPGESAWSDAKTVDTGLSVGLNLGYYFDVFPRF